MYQCDKPTNLLAQLRAMPMFTEVTDDVLQWLIDISRFVCFDKGETIFEYNSVVDHMDIILKGSCLLRREQDGHSREMGIWEAPHVMGVLPFSRLKTTAAEGVALENIQVLRIHKENFVEMVNVSYELVQALVGIMTDRVRDFQNMRLMDEKLMALGKMSAGLAHELNNPASAIVRSSQELHKHLAQTPERFKSIVTMRVTTDAVDNLNQVLFDRIRSYSGASDLSLLQRESRNDDLQDWFDAHDITNGDEIIDTFIDWDWSPEHLDAVAGAVPTEALEPVLWWIEANLTTEGLVGEIQTASNRIAELIGSIKAYSHMDSQASMIAKDIHEGIRSTLTMLKFKFKEKHVKLKKEFDKDLPNVKILEGELNQIWTNLIANALDVVTPDGSGLITIRTYRRRDNVCVDVEDNGTGIPEDIQSRIFEPFFTTKGIGEGTGMGLDIVRRSLKRHGGSVSVESQPGKTCFRICLPL
ncbi:sensor histidine kinase [Neolewinella antarctica]|uniref:histidine kinase n=1 Tax=Neolewinella antarctica TaxID=442734 RepID=A0ABX0XH43_9BACT|nr:ATP-binding protein [Neolewinella antarctica]NJC28098.1 signal transduction histidine kinase [Neolewinella antarctica]